MAVEKEFTGEQQDAYFHEGRCPYCRAQDVSSWIWEHRSIRTRTRDCYCEGCDGRWQEVHFRDVGMRFLEPMT